METEQLISADAPKPEAAAPVTPAAAETTTVNELAEFKAKFEALEGRLADSERANEFWRGRFIAREEAPPPAPKPEPEEEIDVLDLLTSKGEKGVEQLLDRYAKRRGLITTDEADARINNRANQVITENDLMKAYPDLADKKSDFFRSTAEHYGELLQQGVPQATAMRLAAREAELDGIKGGKIKTPAQRTADTVAQRLADRQARAQAQAGERGNRQAAEEDEGNELTDNNRAAIKQLADWLDIPLADAEKRWVARANGGVNVMPKLGGRK